MNTDKLENFIHHHREDFDGESPPAGLWGRIEAAISEEAEEGADPLEAFVAKHRDAFDSETPPPQLADAIFRSPVLQRKIARRRRILSYALGIAASLLLLFTAYHFGNRSGFAAGQQDERVAQQLRDLDPDLAEAEQFYRQRISSEFAKVSQVNDDPQLRLDLEKIDRATAEIRSQLLEVPLSQRHVLVNQLISTYRTKLDILLRIQQHYSHPNLPGASTPAANTNVNES